jgi:hypothetical protein
MEVVVRKRKGVIGREIYKTPSHSRDAAWRARGAAVGRGRTRTPDLSKDNAWYRHTLAELLDLSAAGQINPVVAARSTRMW